MKVVPLNDKIIVKRLEGEEKTAGGIVLPDSALVPDDPVTPLSLYFDLHSFNASEVAETIGWLSDLYREIGGDGLVIDSTTLLDPSLVPQPQEV